MRRRYKPLHRRKQRRPSWWATGTIVGLSAVTAASLSSPWWSVQPQTVSLRQAIMPAPSILPGAPMLPDPAPTVTTITIDMPSTTTTTVVTVMAPAPVLVTTTTIRPATTTTTRAAMATRPLMIDSCGPYPFAACIPPVGNPTIWSCIILRESGGNPNAIERATGAGGLFQFLAATWQSLGYPGVAQGAPIGEQVAAAAALYTRSGYRPWVSDGCPG